MTSFIKFLATLYVGTIACTAMEKTKTLEQLDSNLSVKQTPIDSSGVTNTSITISESIKPITIPYKVYVSAIIDRDIKNSHSSNKEIFKQLKWHYPEEDLKTVFTCHEVCDPHVTLFDGEIDINPSDQEKLEGTIEGYLSSFKGKKVTVKEVEVGGMYAGNGNSYFIAYNLNHQDSDLKKIVKNLKQLESLEGATQKTYGEYSVAMSLNGFKGQFTKHLSKSGKPMLHLSIFRSFTTKKQHKVYGEVFEHISRINEFYKTIKTKLVKTFGKLDDKIINEIFDKMIENCHKKLELAEDIENFKLNDGRTVSELPTKNSYIGIKVLRNALSFEKLLKMKDNEITIKLLKGNTYNQIKQLLDDMRNNPEEFFENKNSKKLKDNLVKSVLKTEGEYLVSGKAVDSENEKCDLFCQILQSEVPLEDLGLKITGFEIKVSPKTKF